MDERFCTVGEIELCYETFGDPADPTLLMVMGLGAQMIAWPEPLCRRLADEGFHVVRFDNRDVGRSTHFRGKRPPTPRQLMLRDKRAAHYTLADMAADAVGLLDHLGVEAAHLAGASMGGMIAQTVTARHPERVLSLASIMSTTGNRRVGQPSPRVYPVLLRRMPRDPDAYVEHAIEIFRMIGSPGFERDEGALRQQARLAYERGCDPSGTGRQLAAIIASGNRTRELGSIAVPTVVIHGSRDRLISVTGGRATARAIPGARYVEIDGMGHDLPAAVWERLAGEIVANARRAAEREPAAA